jgi:hypothetical protein
VPPPTSPRAPTSEDWKKPDPAQSVPDPRYSKPSPPPDPESEPEEDGDAPNVKEAVVSAPAIAVQPAAAQVPAVSWDDSLITLTLTWWPKAEGMDRMVMVSARANSDTPVMRTMFESSLEFPASLAEVLDELKAKLEGAK